MVMIPETRFEAFLAKIAGQEGPDLEPITRTEAFLDDIAGAGHDLEPRTRIEYWLQKIAENAGGGGGSVSFEQILSVTHINDPIATSIANLNLGSFRNAVSAIFPNATGAGNYDAQYAVYRHPNLETLVLPKVTKLSSSTINNCSKFKTLDLGPDFRTYCMQATQNDAVFDTIIIRAASVPELTNINALQGTPFASGGAGGALYVPAALIASYQAATNWSTILGYANNSIQAIEGSIYENQYADGTPIGG